MTLSMLVDNGELTESNRENIQLTFNYISILNYCISLPAASGSSALQFMILESFGFHDLREPKVILNSAFHRL